ncbi:sensor histidine kinase [Pseudobacter ginsenosidimutans]|uniref:Histidine kinase n=1 Tax=Pseudobacter ginsenosidimutans TaxID=661488 RepID=A0A4Q7MKY1_9BACT|nr:histidine kinase [Pseudobacter ginsenosidimutans]RZS68944.1 histidine kinase [Pseudobacter ginsenosidimutans]
MYAHTAWKEPAVLVITILVTEFIYAMPQLVHHGFPARIIKEVLTDTLIMSLACIPGWYLHFRIFKNANWQKRILLHVFTAAVYYGVWLLGYLFYNSFMNLPVMTASQVLQNLWHNILFYVQGFSFLHLFHYFRQREEQVVREKELRRIAYETEIAGLKAQIQPHFLFNTLNSISGSVPAQQEFTRELIARLADIFRYALMASQEDRVPLKQEVDFIRTYLSLEQHRFGERLQVVIHMEEGMEDVMVPTLLFQPLIENALKHGIEPSVEGGVIVLSLTRHAQKLLIRVSNTGLVRNKDLNLMFNTRGVGLRNIQMRLRKLYNENLEVSRTEDCLHFSFHIPIHTKMPARAYSVTAAPAVSFNAMSPVFTNNGM